MPITSYDQIISAYTANDLCQNLPIYKATPNSVSASVAHSLWCGQGVPCAGGYATLGPANGRTCTMSTTGGLPYVLPTTANEMRLLSFGAINTGNNTSMPILVDRISDVNLDLASVGTTNITGLDATSRLDTGEGALLFAEVSSAFGLNNTTFTLTYTNQAGTSGMTTTFSTNSSRTLNQTANSDLWQALAAGDTGIRSIQSYSASGTQTGNVNLVLVRPLAFLNLGLGRAWSEKNMLFHSPTFKKIYDNTCFMIILISSSTGTAFNITGNIKMIDVS
jgi:hypothetical protein